MDMSASLSKATMEAEKERYKKEGRCFFCGAQGHISRGCPKKPPPSKPIPAKLATATITEETTPVKPEETPLTLNQQSVLNYLNNLSNDEYQQMAEAWGRLLTEEDFGQA
jgi:hypothetical protein